MSTVSIVFFSGTGHTTKLAEAVARGVSSVGDVRAQLVQIKGEDIVKGRYTNEAVLAQLDSSDALIFGSPTYMGGPAAQFKAFADASASRWYQRSWKDKLAAGFTVSNSPSGDKLSTLQYFITFALQHGMVWVGQSEIAGNEKGINRLSSFAGAMAQAGQEDVNIAPNEADLLTGETLGKRLAGFVGHLPH
jgi:NAD(P)H dehydrogenase (quinone)